MADLLGDMASGAIAGVGGGPIGIAIGGLGAVLTHYAPDILTGIFGVGGSTGAKIAEAAVTAVKSVTGTDDPDAAQAALQDPKVVTALQLELAKVRADLRKSELDAQAATQQSAVDVLSKQIENIEDARKRDTAIIQAGKTNTRANAILIVACVMMVACVAALAFANLDAAAVGVISTIAGGLVMVLKDASGFEFGSSSGSESKTALMATQAQQATNAITGFASSVLTSRGAN